MKTMILYYSRSGNTEKLATRIRNDLNCDMLRIEPEHEYGNYAEACLRVMGEKAKRVPPQFVTPVPELSSYETVLVGYPIWMQNLPQFVSDFLCQCNLKGKKVIPFATFGMTGISWTEKTLRRVCHGAEIMLPFNYGVFKKDDYDKWIRDVRSSMQ